MREKVENTNAFNGLSLMQQDIYSRAEVIKNIRHHFFVAKAKGLETWLQEFKPSKIIKEIVVEMLN